MRPCALGGLFGVGASWENNNGRNADWEYKGGYYRVYGTDKDMHSKTIRRRRTPSI